MKQQPKHPESFKAFLSFLFALIWMELSQFFSRINVKGNIQIDIPEKAPKKIVGRKVVRVNQLTAPKEKTDV